MKLFAPDNQILGFVENDGMELISGMLQKKNFNVIVEKTMKKLPNEVL